MINKIIKNAVITSVKLDLADRGLLTAWLMLDYGGLHQGFGGFVLYLPKSWTHHKIHSPAGHFIFRCMEVAGVEDWDRLKGKSIRVHQDSDGFNANILGIGHIVKDDWFYPEVDFKEVQND